jgi:hypothetical protein
LKIAIDELKLVSSFEPNKVPAATAVKLEGLLLQGCEFDGRRMVDIKDASGSSRELISVPACYVAWIGGQEPEPHSDGTVSTPIYHTLSRERMLCTINAPN